MYKINRDVFHRAGSLLGAMVLLTGVGSSLLPMAASADALNPLTERSLALSSSSPGWSYTDGSGNATYAFPNSGQNGQKTGETFTFRVSSNATVHAFTLQYCDAPAGTCRAPGDGTGAGQANFKIATSSPAQITKTNYDIIQARGEGALGSGVHAKLPKFDDTEGNFVILTAPANSTPDADGNIPYAYPLDGTSAPIEDWTMTATNQEEATSGKTLEQNMVTLTSAKGLALNFNDYVQIRFYATDNNYITNPGSGAFYAKINDYDTNTNTSGELDPTDPNNTHIIDGGVTVANVMNESIAIQTKVLETMEFSVGTVDPDTLAVDAGGVATNPSELKTATTYPDHGQCNPIATGLAPTDPHNVLKMGDPNAEYSLSTSKTYATHSFWRLSSNSSGGATVYYAGNTLANTVGDTITPIGNTAKAPQRGTEQFGLALDHGRTGNYDVNYEDSTADTSNLEYGVDDGIASHGLLDSTATYGWVDSLASGGSLETIAHNPRLSPLVPKTNYANGGGIFDATYGTVDTQFAFEDTSNTIPVPIASESTEVVDCVTGKMRYIANIAATTPAGIYTTKINYIASPQY